MVNNNISIKSISDLLKCNFFIPSYQRGYRWTEQQVTDLLNDINEFSPKEIPDSNEKTWYCLQPIVVKENENSEWNVIDGQQRLTTIYLILHYLNQGYIESRRKKLFGLKYETRDGSGQYLTNGLNESTIDYTNIDYYFISNSYKTVCSWFEKKSSEFDINSFESKFNYSTKIIWYEASKNEDSIDVFTRINSGKILLTNSELIKALFLNSSNFPNEDADKLRLKQLEISSEWDRAEYTLQNDSFWYFINKNETTLATRIELIFSLISGQNIDNSYSSFYFFSKKFKNKSDLEVDKNWQEIKQYIQTLEEWYNDRELYHKIGYLITIGINIKLILQEKINKTKTAFLCWIRKQIENQIKGANLETIEYGNYNIRNILLLHNIQTILNNKNETNRFPFDRYKKEFWDVEHIHAIATEVKVKEENQIEWLKNNYIKTDKHQNIDMNNKIEQIINLNSITDNHEFETIIDYVLGEDDNSIRNLCLLDRGTNRSYKNDSFKEKRKKIIEREIEGTFIPISTKNVFMKYYSTNAKDIEIWNESDRISYFTKIQEVVNQYVPKSTIIENE